MKVWLIILAMLCVQCKTIRTKNPVSDDAALHNPSGKMRLYAIYIGGASRFGGYCAILENDGKRTLLTTRGVLQEKHLRKAVRYSSKWRYVFWFPHSKAIEEGEKEDVVLQMRVAGDSIFFATENGLRQQRVAAIQDTSGEDHIELKTRKIKIIADRIRQTQPHKGRSDACQKKLKEKFPNLSY